VTVGRSDSLDRQIVDAADIVNEVRMEFDEAVFPNVEFLVEAQHFNISCDKPKMIRALRNSVENAIKSLQGKPGIIKMSNWNDFRFTYFAVQDNGVGMDEKTKTKFLTPYFTTAKKQGGSGIGTMIMQHVMELHGGNIEVNSEKGKGTELLFVIPNYTQHRTPKTIAEKFSAKKEGVND
jgi:signal transduction histidine kinase